MRVCMGQLVCRRALGQSLHSCLLPRWAGSERQKDRGLKEQGAGLWLHWLSASLSPMQPQGWRRPSMSRCTIGLFLGQADWHRRRTEQPRSDENNMKLFSPQHLPHPIFWRGLSPRTWFLFCFQRIMLGAEVLLHVWQKCSRSRSHRVRGRKFPITWNSYSFLCIFR